MLLKFLMNIIVILMSTYYILIELVFLYTSFKPNITVFLAQQINIGSSAFQFLFLLGSIIYYFKSNQSSMKLISTVGIISMTAVFFI